MNPMMSWQIKVKAKQQKQPSFAFQINPELQVKLHLAKLINGKFKTLATHNKIQKSQDNNCLVQNLEHFESVPYSSFKKYELQATPIKTPRKKLKANKLHLENEEPASRKDVHGVKLEQWKSRFHNPLVSKDKTPNRTTSYSQISNTNKKLQSTTFQSIIQYKQAQSSKFRSTFIKSCEGKQKIVSNNTYMRKLKTKMEFYSLSTIMSQREPIINHLSPNVKTIEPLGFEYKHRESQKKGETADYPRRASIRTSKATKFEGRGKMKLIQFQPCRPWTGTKIDLTNDLSNYV